MKFSCDITLCLGTFQLEVADCCDVRALGLVGASGSGKTSLLELIAGLRAPDRGSIVIDGRVLVDRDAGVSVTTAHRRIAYVPQDALLFPHLTVRQNVDYGRQDRSVLSEAEIVSLLELDPLLPRGVGELSGGERQRVALARALFSAPCLLLLDEPLAAVDLPHRRRILEALIDVRDRLGVPMIYVAHAADEVRAIADRVLSLDRGRVVAAGPASTILM
jgi:molybdate transport system ATP-binding protein